MAGIYNFNDAFSGDFFNGLIFKMDSRGVPIDITGTRIDCWMKLDNKTIKKKYSTANGGITITDTDGVFQINSHKITMLAGNYTYDIKISFPDGRVKTWIEGTWVIKKSITEEGRIR